MIVVSVSATPWRTEVALGYLQWLSDVKGAKPSTMSAVRSDLAEPGVAYLRGTGVRHGRIMKALGDRPAREITTREINVLLRTISAAGVAPRTVNKARALICAIFNYGMRPGTWDLSANPAIWADRRREPAPLPLPYVSVEQVEPLARVMESGGHRDPTAQDVGEGERAARAAEDAQDAELIRVAAYSGLRRGELMTLRWGDVRFLDHKLIVSRTLSADVEADSPKGGRSARSPSPTKSQPRSIDSAAGPTTLDPRVRLLQPFRPPPGSLRPASPLRASLRRRRTPSPAVPRPPPHLRLAPGRRRHRPRLGQERHGPLQHEHHRAVPARPSRNRPGGAVHPSV